MAFLTEELVTIGSYATTPFSIGLIDNNGFTLWQKALTTEVAKPISIKFRYANAEPIYVSYEFVTSLYFLILTNQGDIIN